MQYADFPMVFRVPIGLDMPDLTRRVVLLLGFAGLNAALDELTAHSWIRKARAKCLLCFLGRTEGASEYLLMSLLTLSIFSARDVRPRVGALL
jgi:hypothetical protein